MNWRAACLTCLLSLIASVSIAADGPPFAWKVAAGAVVITPEQPVWMGGYAARTKPSEGKVHDLFAKAMVIEDAGGNRLVIVTTDLLGITPELRSGVEDMVKGHGVPPESLLINASHTHCGPEFAR